MRPENVSAKKIPPYHTHHRVPLQVRRKTDVQESRAGRIRKLGGTAHLDIEIMQIPLGGSFGSWRWFFRSLCKRVFHLSALTS